MNDRRLMHRTGDAWVIGADEHLGEEFDLGSFFPWHTALPVP